MKSQLELIEEKCTEYLNDPNFVFKCCIDEKTDDHWIVILKKLDDTVTNESRTNIKNHLYAKFRADKLKVIKIYKIQNPIDVINVDHINSDSDTKSFIVH